LQDHNACPPSEHIKPGDSLPLYFIISILILTAIYDLVSQGCSFLRLYHNQHLYSYFPFLHNIPCVSQVVGGEGGLNLTTKILHKANIFERLTTGCTVRRSNPGGARFSAVQTGPGADPASCRMGTGSFLGLKCGWGVLLTAHPLLKRGQERVELYLYSPSRTSRTVTGEILIFFKVIFP
jgi:hypothetical protein